MTRKADVKFTWVKSPSPNVTEQRFSVFVGTDVISQEVLDPNVEQFTVKGFDSNAVIDWTVETVNKFGMSAMAKAQFTIPDFGVVPAKDLNAEIVETYDVP